MATILVTNSLCLPIIGLFLVWLNKHTQDQWYRNETIPSLSSLLNPSLPGSLTRARGSCTTRSTPACDDSCQTHPWRSLHSLLVVPPKSCLYILLRKGPCVSFKLWASWVMWPLPPPVSIQRKHLFDISPVRQFVLCLKGSYLGNNNSKKASKHDAVFHHCAKGDLGETALKVQRFSMGQSLRVVSPCLAGFVGMMWGRASW